MRFLLTSALILPSLTLTGGTALASSITPLTANGGNGSVVVKTCDHCPPARSREETSGYTVPVLESGPQKTEIVEINGEKKIMRTDIWMGGSPVVHVSKVPAWMDDDGVIAGTTGDGVDHQALVGAVETDEPAALDPETMQLRLQ